MFKKIFYSLTILAMLFGMFGVMGKGGVQPALAAPGDAIPNAARAAAPLMQDVVDPWLGYPAGFPFDDNYYFNNINLAGGATAVPASGCGIGLLQKWVRVPLAVLPGNTPTTSTLHIVATPAAGEVVVVAAWLIDVAGNLVPGGPLGCGDSIADGYAEIVVQVPAGFRVDVMASDHTTSPALIAGGALWIMRSFDTSGGLIVTGIPAANDKVVQLVNATDSDANGDDAQGNAFISGVDSGALPAGTYTMGISSTVGAFAYLYTNVTVPGFVTYAVPLAATRGVINFATNGVRDIFGTAFVPDSERLMPSNLAFPYDMSLGLAALGAVDVSASSWEIAVQDDIAAAEDYYMAVRNISITGGSTYAPDFRANVIPVAFARICEPNLYEDGLVRIDLEGTLNARSLDFWDHNLVAPNCPAGYRGGDLYLSAGLPFAIRAQLTESTTVASTTDYYLVPPNSPWNFAAGLLAPAYTALFGAWYDAIPLGDGDGVRDANENTFRTGVGTLSGSTYTPAPYLDANGNTLSRVRMPDNIEVNCLDINGNGGAAVLVAGYNDLIWDDDDGGGSAGVDAPGGFELNDEIAPCVNFIYGVEAQLLLPPYETNLSNSFALTALTLPADVTANGRYRVRRWIQMGVGAVAGQHPLANTRNILFSNSPTDTPENGHWAWSWVEAMYELGLTNGIGGGNFGPDQVISRAEMAAFLSRVLNTFTWGAIPVAGAGTGTVFSDVPAGYWAAGEIEQLEDLGITSGCGGGNFCPGALVTRAEMAKFIELTYRTVVTYGGGASFDTNINVITPGAVFVDVPAGHWALAWIDELWADFLTNGCRVSGVDTYFCPEDSVTRGQMAKFIVSGELTGPQIQTFWPVLAPER